MPEDKPTTSLPAPIETPLPPREVIDRLRAMSKKGKLPGFSTEGHEAESGGAATCAVAAFGKPFDRDLVVRAEPAGEGSRVSFSFVWRRKLPGAFLAMLVLSVWPGVHLTDSLLNTWFRSYPNEFWVTCAWYLPLTIIPAPFAWKGAITKSERTTAEHAHETREKLAAVLGGS